MKTNYAMTRGKDKGKRKLIEISKSGTREERLERLMSLHAKKQNKAVAL